jgi:DNA-directed RNA polymerase subunit alpha
MSHQILLPSKPRIVSEEETKGVYEIDGLYPGYGHTLGNSLRRIILSSLPGASVTEVKVDGASHEFTVLDGVKEDVINILLNLKKVRFKMLTDEPQTATLSIKGPKEVTAKDIKTGGQLEILNKDQYICEITGKNTNLNIEMKVEKGLGFVPKEAMHKGKVEIGVITLDAIFTPIRRVSYEVENMRVGDKTNHNRLRITIETDGTITPHDALERSIEIMIDQLRAILEFKTKEGLMEETAREEVAPAQAKPSKEKKEEMTEALKTRIDSLKLSTRTLNALEAANIRTIGGVVRKKQEDLLEIEGLGEKGVQEIKKALGELGITLK